MTGWIEVAAIAFVAQLAVLPGEKVQFIIAGLSTRYRPALVVAAAGSAFAGWTVLEILFGSYLQGVLPGVYLDLLAGALFLSFAAMLVRTAPDRGTSMWTDGGVLEDGSLRIPVLGRRVTDLDGRFLPIFALMAVGEFGDKTQLVTIGLAVQYAHPTAIWVGEMAAILPVSLVNAYVFHRFSGRFDRWNAHVASAVLFAFFGLDTLQATVTGFSVWERLVAVLSDGLAATPFIG